MKKILFNIYLINKKMFPIHSIPHSIHTPVHTGHTIHSTHSSHTGHIDPKHHSSSKIFSFKTGGGCDYGLHMGKEKGCINIACKGQAGDITGNISGQLCVSMPHSVSTGLSHTSLKNPLNFTV